MIIYARNGETLSADALRCARNLLGWNAYNEVSFNVGEGTQVSGHEGDYQVWHVRPNTYLVIPVERLQFKEG